MTRVPQLVAIVAVDNMLGEGVQWNEEDGCAWWTDIHGQRLHRLRWVDRAHDCFAAPERIGSFAFIEQSRDMIVAFESGVARFDVGSGMVQWLARPEASDTGRRFNDGRADRQGRFWTGTMVEDGNKAGTDSASLYCLDGFSTLTRRATGFQIVNGLCFSPESHYCYFADSPRHLIYRCEFDAQSGELGPRQVFAWTSSDAFPDGAAVDAEGCMWSAQWGAGQVVRYTPRGEVDLIVPLPTRQPSCVAFGGANKDLLFVTSARAGLTDAQLAAEPTAGHLFIFRTAYAGLSEPRYRDRTTTGSTREMRVTTSCENR